VKLEELVVLREEAMKLDGMEPHRIGEMWRTPRERNTQYPYTRMLASAWLFLHYESLHDGHWPEVMPEEIPSHGGAFHHGPQEIPAIYAAEISARAKECGRDGELLWKCYGDNEETVAPEQFERINQALLYCSGWIRQPVMYSEWRGYMYRADGTPRPTILRAEDALLLHFTHPEWSNMKIAVVVGVSKEMVRQYLAKQSRRKLPELLPI